MSEIIVGVVLFVLALIAIYDSVQYAIKNWVNVSLWIFSTVFLIYKMLSTEEYLLPLSVLILSTLIFILWRITLEKIMGGGDWKLLLALIPFLVAQGITYRFVVSFLFLLSVQLVYGYVLQLFLKKPIPVPSAYLFVLALANAVM